MSRTMISNLIISKLNKGRIEQRPLCNAIVGAAELASRTATEAGIIFDVSHCLEMLAKIAAKYMYLRNIVRYLSLNNSSTEISVGRAVDNALIAAICEGNISLAEILLKMGAKASAKTRFLGEPLAVAAGTGSEDMTLLLVGSICAECPTVPTYFFDLRIMHGFRAAAEAGHQHLVATLIR